MLVCFFLILGVNGEEFSLDFFFFVLLILLLLDNLLKKKYPHNRTFFEENLSKSVTQIPCHHCPPADLYYSPFVLISPLHFFLFFFFVQQLHLLSFVEFYYRYSTHTEKERETHTVRRHIPKEGDAGCAQVIIASPRDIILIDSAS